jgi:hypothetical protein
VAAQAGKAVWVMAAKAAQVVVRVATVKVTVCGPRNPSGRR